jgi:hypothetical protein
LSILQENVYAHFLKKKNQIPPSVVPKKKGQKNSNLTLASHLRVINLVFFVKISSDIYKLIMENEKNKGGFCSDFLFGPF